MRSTDFIMGMPVVIDIPGLQDKAVMETAFDELRYVDQQFSPYRKNSELSRFKRGELTADKVSIGMKAVMKACLEAERFTDGYFSARYDGEFDPSGYVKGWGLSEVKHLLLKKGYKTFCVSAGGDMVAKSGGSKTWRIGIQHPSKKKQLLGRIIAKNIAVATSGTYERGHHIINPRTGKVADEFVSLTVAGPDIIKADILATAAVAMGKRGLDFIDSQLDYEVLAVGKDEEIYISGGMARIFESKLTITGESA